MNAPAYKASKELSSLYSENIEEILHKEDEEEMIAFSTIIIRNHSLSTL